MLINKLKVLENYVRGNEWKNLDKCETNKISQYKKTHLEQVR